ncbi:uncharacterized protein TM35_000301620 [Trypanosoma theileri]|uniref:Uncharacterized protein n=1 Tax=Trypanosoma theileri TaxID=67003 RepID=A0A1X0NN24_9TRYP|nr:uncharacterized protein TM35_000301620 [Trypanosoma theileri]ORC86122.1 hypothetical protein TM35_000301620 [Trypanosoma theileri]
MQVVGLDEGGLCTLSPNQSLYAIVYNHLNVVFKDYIRCTNKLIHNSPPSPTALSQHRRQEDPIISKFTALDEIHELQWSPDSTLVSLLLARRKIVEVVSVYGKCCVARIDAGISGLRAVLWHPSSRVIYWVGLLQVHVLSLVDGEVMRLPGGVKYSAQLAARHSSNILKETVSPNGDNVSHHHQSSSSSSSFSSCETSWVNKPVSKAALLRFSICRRFLVYVTPKSLHSPLLRDREDQGNEIFTPGSEMTPMVTTTNASNGGGEDHGMIYHHTALDREGREKESDGPRRSEWIVILSATTHEELHTFSIGHLVRRVSDCIPLQGGIALVDYIQGSVVVTTYNGVRVLYKEESGVKNVVASKKGDILFIVFAKECRAVVVSQKRVMALRKISFYEDVIIPMHFKNLLLLEEPISTADITAKFSRDSGPYEEDVKDFPSWFNINKDLIPEESLVNSFPSSSHVAMSTSGKIAAVTLGICPRTVLVIDILQQRVLAVLHHRENVVGLFWSPSPSSEYWRFQQRHYYHPSHSPPQRVPHENGNGEIIKENNTSSLDWDEPLMVTTDNHEAKVFMWLSNHPMCFVAPCHNSNSNDDGNNGGKCDLPALRINRAIFGETAEDAVLIDDIRGIALTVIFCNDELKSKK